MVRLLSASLLALWVILTVGCGSTRSALAGQDADAQSAGGASADTYITADQGNGVNARTVVPSSGVAAVDTGEGTFITP